MPKLSSCVSLILIGLTLLLSQHSFAQSESEPVGAVLGEEIVSPSVSLFQLKQFLLKRIAKPPMPTSAQSWTGRLSSSGSACWL